MPAFSHALIVANPSAGRGRARAAAEELAAGLKAAGIAATLHFTGARGDAPRLVRERGSGTDLVLAVGGDGTLREVLSAAPPELTVGQLPLGTANVLAKDLGLPRDVAGLVAAARAGRTARLDTARVGEQLAFLVVGVGFDGAIVREVEQRRRGPITKWSYVRAALTAFRRHSPPALRVEVDGRALPGTYGWVLVSNLVGYGGVIRLATGRVLDDGLWEVLPFRKASRWALLGYGLKGLLRRLPGRSCEVHRARHVSIEADAPVPFEVDGDDGGDTPLHVEVAGRPHTILVASP